MAPLAVRKVRYFVEPLVTLKPWDFKGRRMERNAPKGRKCDETCTHKAPALNTKTCLCPVCHELFSTPNNFDRHRKEGWCILPTAVGLRINEHGVWVGEVTPGRVPGFWAGEDDENE